MCKRGLLNGGNWPVVRMLFSFILRFRGCDSKREKPNRRHSFADSDIEAQQPLNRRRDGLGELWNAFDGLSANNNRSEANAESATGMFDTGGMDLEDFFDFQSWF